LRARTRHDSRCAEGVSPYAELQVTTNFSFLRGGSHPHELVAQAKALGLSAIAITDRNTLAGIVRAHVAAKELGLQLIVGARLDLKDAPSLLCLPTDRQAYGRLTQLLSTGQLRAAKGECTLYLEDVAAHAQGQIFIALPPEDWTWRDAIQPFSAHSGTEVIRFLAPSPEGKGRGDCRTVDVGTPPHPSSQGGGESSHAGLMSFEAELRRLKAALAAPLYLAATHLYNGDDAARVAALAKLAERCGTPLVATGDVLYHAAHRRPLQDVLTCIREGLIIHEAGFKLAANAERHVKSPAEMARLFAGYERALQRTCEIARACRFSLDELAHDYPNEPVPPGKTPQAHLEDLTWEGARVRYPDGIPPKVEETLRKELALIAELNYAPYFLTVHDIVSFARSRGILAQGRGSAANSAVCYCLQITAVNPTEIDLLFERFVSPQRKEPPDIDVDFEHERREEVIQYIYARYGRDRAALAATVICYRARLAVREVGKALGLSEDTVGALAGMVWDTGSGDELLARSVREAGLDPKDPLLSLVIELAGELVGFPRHLSQHVGGFVLTQRPLTEIVPIGNAAMEDRTVIEWDKDDLDALGFLKVDVLGLGMLTCIHRAFDLVALHHGRHLTLANIPREDAAVYDMLCKADSIGVFQVESRAQMNMLPRLKPRTFYDLVIEVAIVRPGPIQGDMVHPYLRRRSGLEAEHYPSPDPAYGPPDELKQILGKTMGVPLFQEQAMRIAKVAARFSDSEVNDVRRAMATFRHMGTIGLLEDKMVSAMVARGYTRAFATHCFNQIKGFGEYGFPESHAASFAHLVYVSAWLKCHYPAAFTCALLNSQPMGFYAPAQLVRDAREHGVEVRPVDVNHSHWDCTLEPGGSDGKPALRLGLRQVDGLAEEEAKKIAAARRIGERVAEGGFAWQTSGHANCVDPRPKKNEFFGSSCGTRGSKATAFAGSTHPMLPTSSASSASSSLKSMAISMDIPPGKRGTRDGADGSKRRDIGSFAFGIVRYAPTCAVSSTQFSENLVTPTPALPLEGEGQGGGSFRDLHDVWLRARVRLATLEKLAAADAFRSLGLDRRQALWEVKGLTSAEPSPLFASSSARELESEAAVELPLMSLPEHVVNDYQTLHLSLKAHPMSFLRRRLEAMRILSCAELCGLQEGSPVSVAGVVLIRQRPGSAKGVVFVTIEDETGIANAVVWPNTLERFRKAILASRLLLIHGRIQRHEDIIHVVSTRLEDKSDWLGLLAKPEEDLASQRAVKNARSSPPSLGHPRDQRIVPKSHDFH
jgi:error-prone DNA polymerase